MIPQLIVIALGMIGLGINITRHGEKRKQRKYNGWVHFCVLLIFWTILHCGGFWNVLPNI